MHPFFWCSILGQESASCRRDGTVDLHCRHWGQWFSTSLRSPCSLNWTTAWECVRVMYRLRYLCHSPVTRETNTAATDRYLAVGSPNHEDAQVSSKPRCVCLSRWQCETALFGVFAPLAFERVLQHGCKALKASWTISCAQHFFDENGAQFCWYLVK